MGPSQSNLSTAGQSRLSGQVTAVAAAVAGSNFNPLNTSFAEPARAGTLTVRENLKTDADDNSKQEEHRKISFRKLWNSGKDELLLSAVWMASGVGDCLLGFPIVGSACFAMAVLRGYQAFDKCRKSN